MCKKNNLFTIFYRHMYYFDKLTNDFDDKAQEQFVGEE
jgi:hypothetical protein